MEAIRSGRIPCLENAVAVLSQIQNDRAVEQGLQVYQCQFFDLVCFPHDPAELSDIHRQAEMAAVDVFIRTSFNDNEQKAQLKLMVLYLTNTKHAQSIKSIRIFFQGLSTIDARTLLDLQSFFSLQNLTIFEVVTMGKNS